MQAMADRDVRIYEVGPRDGLQNEARHVPTEAKQRFIGLLARHRELRRRRDAAPLLSHERAQLAEEIAQVEVEVARIERAMDPPLV